MATTQSTLKAGSGRNLPPKAGRRPKSANRAKASAQRRKPQSAPATPTHQNHHD